MAKKHTFYVMTIPAMVLFFLFQTYPTIQGIFYSFTNWKGYGDWEFVGLDNFLRFFRDDRTQHAYSFTFGYSILSTILVNVISLFVALGLNAKIKFQKTLRAIYFLPNILSVLIIGFIFGFIFSHVIPELGASLGIGLLEKNILGNPNLAWIGIVLVAVWQAVAFNTILYLAGLQTVPMELYEAARIDGASRWIEFWKITFPLIAPFFTINVVVAMREFLMAFDHIVALTNGGPGTSTETISLLIYRGAFQDGDFAYQSANAVLYLIAIVLISVLQIYFLQKREVEL
ncbi:raffinose/stachyose/melibiose transport system permease protein [Aquibacillus albus]|uniref:Raffinose/stachyose/melibiose transport system permease protein n=2 Tax=Aquibacillus albus TaxID=1168171 RepID=A0ABS2N6C2_9BACI|nr:raffinose/stachyose/melibiose transport system permease protein [Aquibacillus albus]